jgi:hypothetical protein
MDTEKAETTDLETMETRDDPVSRIGETGSSEMAGTDRGRRKESLENVRYACDE